MRQFSSVQSSVVSNSLWPHESQHARPPCPSPTPGVHSDSRSDKVPVLRHVESSTVVSDWDVLPDSMLKVPEVQAKELWPLELSPWGKVSTSRWQRESYLVHFFALSFSSHLLLWSSRTVSIGPRHGLGTARQGKYANDIMTEKITTRGDLLFLCFLAVARVRIGMKKKKQKKTMAASIPTRELDKW